MQKLIVANWKSNKNLSEVKQWLAEFSFSNQHQIVIAPPYPFLSLVGDTIDGKENYFLGVQDLSPMPAGSYTGAVGTHNLEGLNVSYAIVGHSERRRYFGEDHQLIANKVSQSLQNKIKPIVCIDEDYLTDQAQAIAVDELSQCIVAYEPLKAIGTGESVEPENVMKIKERVTTLFGNVTFLYGGSVIPANIKQFTQITDGVLVGGASLDATEFDQLIQSA